MTDLTTHMLVEKAKRGDKDAWDKVIDRLAPYVRHWAIHLGARGDVLESILGAVVIRLKMKGLHSFDPKKGKFRPWLATVVANTFKDLRDKEIKERERTPSIGGTDWQEVMNDIAAAESLTDTLYDGYLIELLPDAIARVKIEYLSGDVKHQLKWKCFALTYFQDLKGPAVARELGITLNNVHIYNHEIRQRIKTIVEEQLIE